MMRVMKDFAETFAWKNALILVLMVLGSPLLHSIPNPDYPADFRSGNQALGEASDPTRALEIYLEIEASRGLSTNLALNIATCHYRLQNWGHCRLYLERALLLENHPDAKNNLRVLLNRLQLDEPTPGPLNTIAARLSPDLWFGIGTALILLPFAAFLLARVLVALRSQVQKTPNPAFLTLAFLMLSGGIICLLFAVRSGKLLDSGIVVAEEAYLRQSPFEKSEAIATVREARKLQILDTHEHHFLTIDHGTGIRGWIAAEHFTPILP